LQSILFLNIFACKNIFATVLNSTFLPICRCNKGK
jgi:hypothetical protein